METIKDDLAIERTNPSILKIEYSAVTVATLYQYQIW